MVRNNVIASYLGNVWSSLMGLAFVPLYVRYMGIESYGLVGIFTTLLACMALFDMGLGQALSRELGRYAGGGLQPRRVRELFRSIEIIYVFLALLICVGVILAAPWLAESWLHPAQMSVAEVAEALSVIALCVAIRWVSGLYRSAVMALQRQVIVNVYGAIFATIRGFGVLAVLAFVSPTAVSFFSFQATVALVEAAVLAKILSTSLPKVANVRFSRSVLSEIWPFARGMMIVTFLALMLTQADKVILSKILSLADFGVYTLSATVSSALFYFIYPISAAITPKLAELSVQGESNDLRNSYHRYSQLMTVAIIPSAIVVSIFSSYLMLAWTADAATSHKASPIVSLLALGTMLNGLLQIPYALQIAFGRTKLMIWINVVGCAVLIPALYLITPIYGGKGAACIWLALNFFYLCFSMPLLHRTLLRGELRQWYLGDVLPPAVSVGVVVGGLRWLLPRPDQMERMTQWIVIVAVSAAALITGVVASPAGRIIVRRFLGRLMPARPLIN